PQHFSHSRIAVFPVVTASMSRLQRGHFRVGNSAAMTSSAAAPQCGQWRLPMNIIPKHDAHATVASFDSQYLHCGASDEIAAPQFGQLRVFASIVRGARILRAGVIYVRLATILPAVITRLLPQRVGALHY